MGRRCSPPLLTDHRALQSGGHALCVEVEKPRQHLLGVPIRWRAIDGRVGAIGGGVGLLEPGARDTQPRRSESVDATRPVSDQAPWVATSLSVDTALVSGQLVSRAFWLGSAW